jgi:hypothetical protein
MRQIRFQTRFSTLKKILASLFVLAILGQTPYAWSKTQKQWFAMGVASYLASQCADAFDPLYQASIQKGPQKPLAHLYLAHCQSVFKQNENAAYNLSQVKADRLQPADRELYDSLMDKHKNDFKPVSTLVTTVLGYLGQTSYQPDSTKASSQFFGLYGALAWPTLNLGLGYESLSMDLKPAALKDYSQTMAVFQGGYFWSPSFKTSISLSSIQSNSKQMESILAPGIQLDYFFSPFWSLFAEFYKSSYPKLLADIAGTYKYPVDATEAVLGGRFPLFSHGHHGASGLISLTHIALDSSEDKAALLPKTLNKDSQKIEAIFYGWIHKNSLSLGYWLGTETLGIRERGSVVNNGTDRKKGGFKLSLDRTFGDFSTVGLSYGSESFEAIDYTTAALKDYQSSTVTAKLGFFW